MNKPHNMEQGGKTTFPRSKVQDDYLFYFSAEGSPSKWKIAVQSAFLPFHISYFISLRRATISSSLNPLTSLSNLTSAPAFSNAFPLLSLLLFLLCALLLFPLFCPLHGLSLPNVPMQYTCSYLLRMTLELE